MRGLDLGRTGKIVIVIVFGLLAGENLFIWLNSGVIPAIEFLLLDALVVVIVAAVIIGARRHQLP